MDALVIAMGISTQRATDGTTIRPPSFLRLAQEASRFYIEKRLRCSIHKLLMRKSQGTLSSRKICSSEIRATCIPSQV